MKWFRITSLSALLPFVALSSQTSGSSAAQPAAPPAPCVSEAHHQFDFWIGNWQVTDSAGATPYGTSSITREEGGCLIHEHWTGSKGVTGQSLNYYSRELKQWEQLWVGSGGANLHIIGHKTGNTMRLEGSGFGPNGGAVDNRVDWSLEPDGRVRQFWKISIDGGKTWTVSFDGWYKKVPA